LPRFDVHVVPRSSRAGPQGRHDGAPRLRVTAPPAGGAANAEAERLLTDLVGARVTLVGGAKSRRKTFDVNLEQNLLDARLTDAFGG